ncbi:MAG: helix-turn-helix domain-containing protein [Clostridia bacterium]|nr:helix-turn-helix domain-containing protein [Clostridia bacterium]
MSQKMQRAKDIILFLRNKHELTQLELAKKARVSNVTISDIEAGKVIPRPETLEKIANVFGMDMVELLQCNVERIDRREVRELSPDDKEILDWAANPENIEYIKFAYNIANKGVPKSMLHSLKIEII